VATARAETIVVRAGKVIPVSGPSFRDGAVVVENGKIVAVGRGIKTPSGARVLRAAVVMPGLVDPHSYLGCFYDKDEPVDAVTPDIRACDGFDPEAPALGRALREGVTTVGIAPGNGGVIAGQISAVRLGVSAQVIKGYAAQKMSLSLDAANPQRKPTSRAGAIALAEAALDAAGRGRAVSSTTQTSLLVGEFSTRLSERVSALTPVLGGQAPVFFHAPRTVDVETALRVARERHLVPVLLHSSSVAQAANSIRSSKAIVIVGPLALDASDRVLADPGKLAKEGIGVAFCSDAPLSDPGSLRMSAHLAVQNGMDASAAIRALTLNGAKTLGISGRTGSLEKGIDADLLLLSGDPLDLTSRVEAVISGGAIVYQAGSDDVD
jgi:imidazolonepropionase-like amidohydrolase